MKLLVTGGLGYIGGRFLEMSSARTDTQVTATSRRRVAGSPQPAGATVLQVDGNDGARLTQVCRGIDAIVHLAGMNAAECQRDPEGAVGARVAAASAWLSAAVSSGVPRFVYVSTAHVYGAALAGRVEENTPPQPQQPYAHAHFAAEEVVRAARARGDVDAVVARVSNAFGAPASSAECWSLVVNDLCRQAVYARRMTLRTQGRQRRDLVAMSEVCRALLFLCEVPRGLIAFDTFNVGGGDAPTILELTERIAACTEARLGFRPEVVPGNAQDAVGAGPLDFRADRLARQGFEALPGAGSAELHRLIDFCSREAGV